MGDAWEGAVDQELRAKDAKRKEEQRRDALKGRWICWSGSGVRYTVEAVTSRAAVSAALSLTTRQKDTFFVYPAADEDCYTASIDVKHINEIPSADIFFPEE